MSEQTRHATPNLLISIHILWLLISSLLHSLFYPPRHPVPSPLISPPPSPRFTRSLTSSRSSYLRPTGSVLLFCDSFLCLSPIRAIFFCPFRYPSSPVSPSVGFCPLSSLRLSSPFFLIYLLIFSLNSIPRRRKNPRDFFSLVLLLSSPGRRFLVLTKSSRDFALPETWTSRVPASYLLFRGYRFLSPFSFRHRGISSQGFVGRRQLAHC